MSNFSSMANNGETMLIGLSSSEEHSNYGISVTLLTTHCYNNSL